MIGWLRLLPYAASGLLVLGVWWLWSDRAALKEDNARLNRELAVQARVIEQRDEANDVLKAHLARARTQASEASQLDRQFREGGDVPLSDYLRESAGRLWR